jgi:hypothetical protein
MKETKMKFKIERNYCKCHPETCCHGRYVLLINGVPVADNDDKDSLQSLIEKINEGEKK